MSDGDHCAGGKSAKSSCAIVMVSHVLVALQMVEHIGNRAGRILMALHGLGANMLLKQMLVTFVHQLIAYILRVFVPLAHALQCMCLQGMCYQDAIAHLLAAHVIAK